MLTILLTIIARTEIKGQSIKATNEVEPQSSRKSRNYRFLVILTIFQQFGRGLTCSKFKNIILNYATPEFIPITSLPELHRSRDVLHFQI